MPARFDIVVIGSGAGGATLTQRPAPTGKPILILERGEHLPREAENWSPKAVFIERRYRTQKRCYDREGRAFTRPHYWVDRKTTFYGAALKAQGRTMAPVHAKATANARRLKR